jgi:voltage-gated sodium channel
MARLHLPGTDDVEDHRNPHALVRGCAALADSTAFNVAIFGVILANAIVLGLETYDTIERDHDALLSTLDRVFYAIFVVEISIRFVAVGANPRRFFRSGWNTFDFVVIAAALVPGVRENATLLRLARLARIVRVVRLLPDLRVLTTAIVRAIPASLSLVVLGVLVLFLYGMVGWSAFGEEYPAQYGNVGDAMLTLFVTLTLENFPDQLQIGRDTSFWATLYFISFALVAAFLLFNILIGIVINSMEEARTIEHARQQQVEREAALRAGLPAPAEDLPDPDEDVVQQITDLRTALDALEASLKVR